VTDIALSLLTYWWRICSILVLSQCFPSFLVWSPTCYVYILKVWQPVCIPLMPCSLVPLLYLWYHLDLWASHSLIPGPYYPSRKDHSSLSLPQPCSPRLSQQLCIHCCVHSYHGTTVNCLCPLPSVKAETVVHSAFCPHQWKYICPTAMCLVWNVIVVHLMLCCSTNM